MPTKCGKWFVFIYTVSFFDLNKKKSLFFQKVIRFIIQMLSQNSEMIRFQRGKHFTWTKRYPKQVKYTPHIQIFQNSFLTEQHFSLRIFFENRIWIIQLFTNDCGWHHNGCGGFRSVRLVKLKIFAYR